MTEKRITWTVKTRRGMKRLVDAGNTLLTNDVAGGLKLTKAQLEELEAAKTWLKQELEEDGE